MGVLRIHQQGHGHGLRAAAEAGGGDGRGEAIRGIDGVQTLGIEGGGGVHRELGHRAVAHEEGADAAGAVDTQAHGPAQVGIVEGGTGGIEAQVVQNGGVRIGEVSGGHGAGGGGIGQVAAQQLHLPGVKGVGNGVAVFAGVEIDPVHGELLLLPPGGVCGEIRPLGAGGGHIGVAPGAGGHQLPLGAGLDNGNIQQGEEGGIGTVETDGKGLGAAGGNGGNLAQPSGVPGRGLGPAQSGHRIRGGEGRPVGKGDAAAQGNGPGIAGGVIAPGLGQNRLRLQGQAQAHQALVEELADVLLGTVRAGDGVQGQALEIGQGKGGDGGVFILLLLLIVVGKLVINFVGIGIGVGSAAPQQGQQHTQSQQQGKQAFYLHSGSSSASRAICAPRALPTLRWDQYRSWRQAVQWGQMSM